MKQRNMKKNRYLRKLGSLNSHNNDKIFNKRNAPLKSNLHETRISLVLPNYVKDTKKNCFEEFYDVLKKKCQVRSLHIMKLTQTLHFWSNVKLSLTTDTHKEEFVFCFQWSENIYFSNVLLILSLKARIISFQISTAQVLCINSLTL